MKGNDKYYWKGFNATNPFTETIKFPKRKQKLNISVSHKNANGGALNGYLDFYVSHAVEVGYSPLGTDYRHNITTTDSDPDAVLLISIDPDVEAMKIKYINNDVNTVDLYLAITNKGE